MSDRAGAGPLRSHRIFRALWAARTVSHIGDGVALAALVLHVQRTEDTGLAVGGLLLAGSLPRLAGPIAGAIADRTDQRRLMIGCDLTQAAVYALLAIALPPYPVLLAAVAVASLASTLFAPAGRSAVPALVEPAALMRANAWLGLSLNLQVVVGPLFGALLFDALGIRTALGIDVASFLVSAMLTTRLPALPPEPTGLGLTADVRAGFGYLRTHAVARRMMLILFFGVMFAGVDNVALVFLVRDTLGAAPLWYGVVLSSFGFGMVAGSLLLARRGGTPAGLWVYAAGWVLLAVGTLVTGIAPVVVVAMAGQALGGFGNGLDVVAGDTLLQSTVERGMLGRVFGIRLTAALAGDAIASAAGGALMDVTSPRFVFLAGAAGTALVAAWAAGLALRQFRGVERPGAQDP